MPGNFAQGRAQIVKHIDKVRPKVERVAWAMCESDFAQGWAQIVKHMDVRERSGHWLTSQIKVKKNPRSANFEGFLIDAWQ
jgi:hypothetical protein